MPTVKDATFSQQTLFIWPLETAKSTHNHYQKIHIVPLSQMKGTQEKIETAWSWNFSDDLICNKRLLFVTWKRCISSHHNKDILIFCFFWLHTTFRRKFVGTCANKTIHFCQQMYGSLITSPRLPSSVELFYVPRQKLTAIKKNRTCHKNWRKITF